MGVVIRNTPHTPRQTVDGLALAGVARGTKHRDGSCPRRGAPLGRRGL
jgi:hypothetical protein